MKGVPAADFEVGKPRRFIRGLAGLVEDTIAIGHAGFAEIVVPISGVPGFDNAPEIAAKLLDPSIAEEIGIRLDDFGVMDFRF